MPFSSQVFDKPYALTPLILDFQLRPFKPWKVEQLS